MPAHAPVTTRTRATRRQHAVSRPRSAGTHRGVAVALACTAEQRKALAALQAAAVYAQPLRLFFTPASVLNEETIGDVDAVLAAIGQLAATYFGGGVDYETTLANEMGRTLTDVNDVHNVHLAEVLAQLRAAFALGVAWGRLDATGTATKGGA